MSSSNIEPLRYQSRLDIYLGPMFSGKSTTLIRKLTLLAEMGLNALYINHGIDTRSQSDYSTHSPLLQDCELMITTMKATKLQEIPISQLKSFDIIGIDEAQFFKEEMVPFVRELVDVHHKYVIVVGLDGSFKREKLGYTLDLIPMADNVVKLHAYCKRCATMNKTLRSALFTHYTAERLESDSIIIVGGAEKYQAVCRECYLELNRAE